MKTILLESLQFNGSDHSVVFNSINSWIVTSIANTTNNGGKIISHAYSITSHHFTKTDKIERQGFLGSASLIVEMPL